MPEQDLPPVLPTATPGLGNGTQVGPGSADAPRVAPWRLWIALVLLTLSVAAPSVAGFFQSESRGVALPGTVRGLLIVCGVELALFSLIFGTSTAFARFSWDDLRLRWRGSWWIWARALGWSIALRLSAAVALGIALAVSLFFKPQTLENLGNNRPKIEAIIQVDALYDPVYLILVLTVVSFGLAGLREELWRAGMLSLMSSLRPTWFGGNRGPWLALIPVSILFGLGHSTQGWIGVGAATVLGLGLGAIMLFHRSTWDAVLAHGFFDATTFALLPLLAHLIPGLNR